MQPFDEEGDAASRSDRLREWVSASPWLTISVLLHVIALSLLAVIYLHDKPAAESQSPLTLGLTRPTYELLEPEPPRPIDFDRPVPLLDKRPTPDPDVKYIDDALPVPKGEYFADSVDTSLPPGPVNWDPNAIPNLPSLDTGGSSIGVQGPGHFGERPSIRSGTGRGKSGKGGGPGDPRGGGRPPEEPIVTTETIAALQWLANHQSPDGRWDCDGFDAQCRKNRCDGRGESTYDVGVTGLSLLCFLGAGFTHQQGPFKKTVKDGLLWLKSVQDEDGIFGGKSSQHYQYNHACAALAMVEAWGMTGATPFREPAQKGVAWVLRSQNPYRAWRYGAADGDNDSSVTGWMTMVLKSAAMAGLDLEHVALDHAANFIDEMTDDAGRTGYQTRGGLPARVEGPAMTKFPSEKSESLTAVGLLVRIFDGRTAGSDDKIMKGADLLAAKPPAWDGGSVDFYYWYYGTLALFQVGGPRWEKWNGALKTAILAHQNLDKSRDEFGSWDPVDPWSQEGGRVYATALNALCTEVYYRYPRVFGVNREGAPKPK
jgi:hypothetical protein